MKLNSAFSKAPQCPNCKKYVIGQNNKPDPPWNCIFCPGPAQRFSGFKICSWCYWEHTAELHPNGEHLDPKALPCTFDPPIVKAREDEASREEGMEDRS